MDLHTFLFLLGCYLASGALNSLLAFKSAEEWELCLITTPRTAKAMKLLRKIGLDLPGLLRIVLPALQNAIARFSGKGAK